jgi:hypothetical protein
VSRTGAFSAARLGEGDDSGLESNPGRGKGKTFALLLDDCYHLNNSGYSSVIFRREYPQIMNPGGLWDTATKIFPYAGGKPNESKHHWLFPSGAVVRFAHLQLERDKLAWQGTQLVRLAHDELNQFSESSVHYLRSRLRSVSGIRPYTRSTTNADADSWVANFLQWWWDPETGFPIPNRAGVVRWFVREEASGIMKWSSSPHDLKWAKAGGVAIPPTSVTFIPARLEDNQILLAKNPEYRTTLMSLPPVELAQLYYGNWKIKPAAGSYFKRHWFQFVDAAPLHR